MHQHTPTFTKQGIALMLIFVLLAVSACGILSGGLNNGCAQDEIDALRVTLPASASNVTENCVEGFAPGNAQYTATFNIAAADLSALQTQTDITTWETTIPANASVFDKEAVGLTNFQYGSFGDGAISEEVLVDMTDPQQYKIHFFRAYID